MRIGITFDLKDATTTPTAGPDDLQEEYDSPVTIEAIASVLRDLGHQVDFLGDGRTLIQQILSDPPDFVFNIAEGEGIGRSREARVPALLEMLGIPYTGSDPLTLAVTLDKECAKRLVASDGVTVPKGLVVNSDEDVRLAGRMDSTGFPVIVKPAWEGSSKGIRNGCVVHSAEDLVRVLESMRRDYVQPILVEEFISGEELTVGFVGGAIPQTVGIMRVIPTEAHEYFIYSLEVKRDYERQVRYECPAQLSVEDSAALERAARACWRALGCRDVARIDFRLRRGIPYFLEVNPLPGLNPQTSDLVILARLAGWSYARLVQSILAAAMDRQAKLNMDGPSGS